MTISVDTNGVLQDPCTQDIQTKLNCYHCVFSVDVSETGAAPDECLLCGASGPQTVMTTIPEYRCTNGFWLCRITYEGKEDSFELLDTVHIYLQRIQDDGILEILTPWV
jgi:hypothetical protein